MTNLLDSAQAQYGDWSGTLAGDHADGIDLARLLGVDVDQWRLVIIDVSISGGTQYVTGYAVPHAVAAALMDGTHPSRRVDVTRVSHSCQPLSDDSGTNPPDPPTTPLTWVGDLLTYGFKRLNMRFVSGALQAVDEAIEVDDVTRPGQWVR